MSHSREVLSAGIDGAVMDLGMTLVRDRVRVLHIPTGVYGLAVRYHPPGDYKGADGVSFAEHVLEIDAKEIGPDGKSRVHAFLMRPQEITAVFHPLAAVEVEYLDTVAGELAVMLTRAIGTAKAVGLCGAPLDMPTALALIGVVMQGQLRALQSASEEGGAG